MANSEESPNPSVVTFGQGSSDDTGSNAGMAGIALPAESRSLDSSYEETREAAEIPVSNSFIKKVVKRAVSAKPSSISPRSGSSRSVSTKRGDKKGRGKSVGPASGLDPEAVLEGLLQEAKRKGAKSNDEVGAGGSSRITGVTGSNARDESTTVPQNNVERVRREERSSGTDTGNIRASRSRERSNKMKEQVSGESFVMIDPDTVTSSSAAPSHLTNMDRSLPRVRLPGEQAVRSGSGSGTGTPIESGRMELFRKAISDRDDQISAMSATISNDRAEFVRSLGLSLGQVQHLVTQVKASERHIEEQELQMIQAGAKFRDLVLELHKTQQVAQALYLEKNEVSQRLNDVEVNNHLAIKGTIDKYEDLAKKMNRDIQDSLRKNEILDTAISGKNQEILDLQTRISIEAGLKDKSNRENSEAQAQVVALRRELDLRETARKSDADARLAANSMILEKDTEIRSLKKLIDSGGKGDAVLRELSDKYRFERDTARAEVQELASEIVLEQNRSEAAREEHKQQMNETVKDFEGRIGTLDRMIALKDKEITSLRARDEELGSSTADRVELENFKVRLQTLEREAMEADRENQRVVSQCEIMVKEAQTKAETKYKSDVERYEEEIRKLKEEAQRIEDVNTDLMIRMNEMARAASRPVQDRDVSAESDGNVAVTGSKYDVELARIRQEAGLALPAPTQPGDAQPPTSAPAVVQVSGTTTVAKTAVANSGATGSGGGGDEPGGGGGGTSDDKDAHPASKDTGRKAGKKKEAGGDDPDDPDDGDDDDDDDDEDESDEDDEDDDGHGRGSKSSKTKTIIVKNSASKRKEADKVIVPKFPTLAQFPQWKIQLCQNLIQASGRDDSKEVDWFNEVSKPGSTMDGLADSGAKRFRSLDLKLGASLGAVVRDSGSENLIDDLAEKNLEAMSSGAVLKGRQVLWLLFNHFKTNPSLTPVYSIVDLMGLGWWGDDSMHGFRHMWNFITRNMAEPLNENTLRDLLLERLNKSKVLQADISHYHRLSHNDPDRSYNYLRNCMNRYLERTQMTKTRDDYSTMLKKMAKHGGGAPAAPGPKAKAKPKAKSKGKGKGKGGKGEDDKKLPCYFHHNGGCTFSAKDCRFSHDSISDEKKKELVRPRSRSPTRPNRQPPAAGAESDAEKAPAPKAKAKAKAKAAAGPMGGQIWCKEFLKPQGCKYGNNCIFAHIHEDGVRACQQAIDNKKKRDDSNPPKRKQD